MAKKCRISYYNVVSAAGTISYGYRCMAHGVMSQRFSSEALLNERVAEHRAKPKSTKKY